MRDAKALFNSRAAGWDKYHPEDREKIGLMLALSAPGEGTDLLDVGCGTGVLEPHLLRYNPRKVIAVDFADQMIALARRKVADPRVEFRCADIYSLEGELCDSCFLYNAYPHFPEPGRLLAHLASLLRPGGRLTISHNRGKTDEAYIGQTLFGYPVHPNQALVKLMRPHFHVDAAVDNEALLLISGTKRATPQ